MASCTLHTGGAAIPVHVRLQACALVWDTVVAAARHWTPSQWLHAMHARPPVPTDHATECTTATRFCSAHVTCGNDCAADAGWCTLWRWVRAMEHAVFSARCVAAPLPSQPAMGHNSIGAHVRWRVSRRTIVCAAVADDAVTRTWAVAAYVDGITAVTRWLAAGDDDTVYIPDGLSGAARLHAWGCRPECAPTWLAALATLDAHAP